MGNPFTILSGNRSTGTKLLPNQDNSKNDRPNCLNEEPSAWNRWCRGLQIVFLLLAACLPYLNSIQNSFHFDDSSEIVQNEKIRSIQGLQSARPVTRWLLYATFFVNYRMHSLSCMAGWHAFNILLHAACVLVLYWTLDCLLSTEQSTQMRGLSGWQATAPFCGALLFAVHPLASEPVNYIQARCVLMYTLFSLLSLLGAIRFYRSDSSWRKAISCGRIVAFVLLACISKEVGLLFSVALPFLYCLIFVFPRSPHKLRLLGCLGGALVLLGLAAGTWLWAADAWLAIRERLNGDLGHYFWSQTIVFWRYVALAVWPTAGQLNVDHAVIYRPYSLTDANVLASVVAMALIVLMPAICLIRKVPAASYLLLAIPIGLLPYFVMTSAEAMVEYRFYLPLAACCGLAGMAAAFLFEKSKTVGILLLALVVVALAEETVTRNHAWRSELSLWSDAALKSPRKARTINGLAWAMLSDKTEGDPRRALELAKRSLDPRYVDLPPGFNPYMVDTLAEAYFANGETDEALRIEQAILEEGVGDLDYFRKQVDRFKAAPR